MAIKDTKYLSQFSMDELTTLHKQWPNAILTPDVVTQTLIRINLIQPNNNLGQIIGVALSTSTSIAMVTINSIRQKNKMKKQLRAYAAARSLPAKEVLKEFKQHYVPIMKELKAINYSEMKI